MGLSDLGSNEKEAFEENKTIATKISLKAAEVVNVRNYRSLN